MVEITLCDHLCELVDFKDGRCSAEHLELYFALNDRKASLHGMNNKAYYRALST